MAEYYKVFLKVVLKEIEKSNLDAEVYSTCVTQFTASLTENFTGPYNRCAYMFRFATANTYCFKECIKKFLLEYCNIKDIFSLWKSYSEVKVCSLSVGPGLDYLGFLLAVLEYDPFPPNFNGVKIVSKYGAWRNTVKLMLEVFREQDTVFEVAWPNLKYENVSVIQADLLKSYSENGKIVAVSEANVILMMRTLNLLATETTQEGPLLHMLKGLISSLKPEAIIFCIDTKPSLALITQALSHFPGKFLYGPIHKEVRILPDELPDINKCRPSIKARGTFFAWQNLPTTTSLDLCVTPPANLPVFSETKEDNLADTCNTDKSNDSSMKGNSKVEDKDPDNDSSPPWIELKSFWKCSSPKTKDLLKRLMLTNGESLEQINDLISLSEENPLNTIQTSMLEDIELSKVQNVPLNITQTAKLKDKVIPTEFHNEMHDLSVDSLQNTAYNCSNLQHRLLEGNSCDSVDSLSPSGTLNSVSSFTCENDSLSGRIEGKSTGSILKSTLGSYHAFDKNNSAKVRSTGDTQTKVISAKTGSSENKVIQTDALQDISTDSSSVKALTERIRQLAISLESASQQNEPCSYDGGEFNEPRNCQTEGFQNFAGVAGKPFCSKQSASCDSQNQDSLPSYKSVAEKNVCIRNMDCHYSCQCCYNRCNMHDCLRSCSFQPCCVPQPVRRCNFSCNRQQSTENNLGNFTSPTIVIPVQNISDNALLQIISILKSESKN